MVFLLRTRRLLQDGRLQVRYFSWIGLRSKYAGATEPSKARRQSRTFDLAWYSLLPSFPLGDLPPRTCKNDFMHKWCQLGFGGAIEENGIAHRVDAKELSALRLQIDGETENMDRERGEAFIDIPGFEQIIWTDTVKPRNLFLVVVAQERIVGFSRCEGTYLQRFSHKVEFGVCVAKDFWGYGIGKNLLKKSIAWADSTGIQKMSLQVLETNEAAIHLYKKLGFEIEGILKKDKLLADGNYYDTLMMGRWKGIAQGSLVCLPSYSRNGSSRSSCCKAPRPRLRSSRHPPPAHFARSLFFHALLASHAS